MKRIVALVLAALMLFALAACGASPAAPTVTEKPAEAAPATDTAPAGDPIVLKFGHGNSTEQLVHIYAERWAELVSDATDGRITIEVYPGGALGSLTEMLEAVSLGTLDIFMGDMSTMGEYLPAIYLTSQPFFIESFDHAAAVYDSDIVAGLLDELAAGSNLRVLGVFWNGFRDICSNRPITSVADCKDLLIRSPEADLYMNTFKTLGMAPTPIPWGDTYTAVESGVAEACETNPEAIYSYGFYNITKYVCKSHHIFNAVGPTINEQTWQKLSPEDQAILKSCLDQAVAEEREAYAANDETVYAKLEAEGVTLTEFDNRQEIIDLFKPTWSAYAEKCNAVELLDQLMALGK